MEDIFDRTLRRRARARAMPGLAAHDFLPALIREELAARAGLLPLDTSRSLYLGAAGLDPATVPPGAVVLDPAPELLAQFTAAVAADEDRLPFSDASFTAVIAAGTLHGVNDLPGCFVQLRRVLRPGGWLLAGFVGGAGLGTVRAALARAEDEARGAISPRVGPTLDPQQVAGLLQRAGFQDPVVDTSILRARYANLAAVAREARGMGETGWLASRARIPLTRTLWSAAERAFASFADPDGRIPVEAALVTVAARAP
jgi:SAM-dependent methyltransferase